MRAARRASAWLGTEEFATTKPPRGGIVTDASATKAPLCSHFVRVSDGTRTHDRLDHNQELYQLSYAHQGPRI